MRIIYNAHLISNSVVIKYYQHSKCEHEIILGAKNYTLDVILEILQL